MGRNQTKGSMRKLKLEEVVNMEEGEIVPAVSGIVESIYKQRSGVKDDKPWSFQDLVIKDGTQKIGISVSGRDEIPSSVKGKLLTFISSNGSRGMTGVKIILDTYNGETRKKLRVTPTAEIIEGAGQWENQPATTQQRRSPTSQEELERQKAAASTGRQSANKPLSREFDNDGDNGDGWERNQQHDPRPQPQDPPPQQQAPPPESPRRESVEPGPWFGAPTDWKKFDLAASKHYRLMQRTLTMTHAIAGWAEQRGIVVTPEHFQAMQAQLFIEANRQHLGDLVPNCEPPEPKG
jgi:hypothetical protein